MCVCGYVHTYVYKCFPKTIWKNTTELLTRVLMRKRMELEKTVKKEDYHFIIYVYVNCSLMINIFYFSN